MHLPPGKYRVKAEAIGHQPVETDIHVDADSKSFRLKLGPATTVSVIAVSEDGKPVPCKASFYGAASSGSAATRDPIFGIDSQSGAVGNCVYSADGRFTRSIPPGTYDFLLMGCLRHLLFYNSSFFDSAGVHVTEKQVLGGWKSRTRITSHFWILESSISVKRARSLASSWLKT